jgi:hypothetical protein
VDVEIPFAGLQIGYLLVGLPALRCAHHRARCRTGRRDLLLRALRRAGRGGCTDRPGPLSHATTASESACRRLTGGVALALRRSSNISLIFGRAPSARPAFHADAQVQVVAMTQTCSLTLSVLVGRRHNGLGLGGTYSWANAQCALSARPVGQRPGGAFAGWGVNSGLALLRARVAHQVAIVATMSQSGP